MATLLASAKQGGVPPPSPTGQPRNLRAGGMGVDLDALAVEVLLAAPRKVIVPRLLRALAEPGASGRVQLIHALGHMGAVPLAALEDRNGQVRRAAALSQPRLEALPVLFRLKGEVAEEAARRIGAPALPALLAEYGRRIPKPKPVPDGGVVIEAIPDTWIYDAICAIGRENKKAFAQALKDPAVRPDVRSLFQDTAR